MARSGGEFSNVSDIDKANGAHTRKEHGVVGAGARTSPYSRSSPRATTGGEIGALALQRRSHPIAWSIPRSRGLATRPARVMMTIAVRDRQASRDGRRRPALSIPPIGQPPRVVQTPSN